MITVWSKLGISIAIFVQYALTLDQKGLAKRAPYVASSDEYVLAKQSFVTILTELKVVRLDFLRSKKQ